MTATTAGAVAEIRLLDGVSSETMLAVNRACPVVADYTFYFDRAPDFFAWPERVFQQYRYAGVYQQGAIVGYCLLGYRTGRIGDGWETYFYVGDARVLPSARGHRLAERAALALESLIPEGVRLGAVVVKTGNRPADWIVRTARPDDFIVQRQCGLEVVSIPLLLPLRATRECSVRPATLEDAPEVAALMQRAYTDRLLAPRVDQQELRRLWQTPGRGAGQYRVAVRDRRIVGVVGFWDMGPLRRTRVVRYSRRGAWLRRLYDVAARLSPGPAAPLPAVGEAFGALTAVDVAIEGDDPGVLREILAAVVADHRGKGYHLLHVGFGEGDPLRTAVRSSMVQRFHSDLYLLVRRREANRIDPGQVPYVDLAMI
jgi:hypothetical protein